MEDVLALNVDRKVMLIALGGGVIGDLVGFVAASLTRGVDLFRFQQHFLLRLIAPLAERQGLMQQLERI